MTPEISYGAAPPVQLGSVSNAEGAANVDSFNGRVMLIDGTSVIHRAYYKLLGMHCCSCLPHIFISSRSYFEFLSFCSISPLVLFEKCK